MTTEEKDIYAIGEVPPLGFVPKKMHAWVIRKDRHGNPMQSFQSEEVGIPEIGPSDVLVLVMAAGVNYNGVWAGLGKPISVLDVTKKIIILLVLMPLELFGKLVQLLKNGKLVMKLLFTQ